MPNMMTAIFAPTNDAFTATTKTNLPIGTLNYLLRSENYDLLVNILQHHVLNGRYYMGIGVDDTTVTLPTMLNDTFVDVTIDTDYVVTNVNGSGLASVAYFVKSTTEDNDDIDFVGYQVDTVDIDSSNGVIHSITALLIPDSLQLPDDVVTTITQEDEGEDISENYSYSLFADAMKRTKVISDLTAMDTAEDTLYTIFAPTNDAWELLHPGLVQALLLEENVEILREIVLQHVVEIDSADAILTTERLLLQNGNFRRAFTMAGETIDITVIGAGDVDMVGSDTTTSTQQILIDRAQIVDFDIECTNGVIQGIDRVLISETVLLPQPLPVTIIENIGNGYDIFIAAVKATVNDNEDLFKTLMGKGPYSKLKCSVGGAYLYSYFV